MRPEPWGLAGASGPHGVSPRMSGASICSTARVLMSSNAFIVSEEMTGLPSGLSMHRSSRVAPSTLRN